MSDALLTLENVGKDYARAARRSGHLRLLFDLLRGNPPTECYRALDNVSFSLRRGESLGVIGENGAGKSTLLKVIAEVIPPTRGRLEVRGKISALLELGSGFHPEYTGLENIGLAGSLAGLSDREVRAKRDEIIDFADIGEHIHQPIKTYSSGMIVRLGFAVATAVKPEILITDEVLAVGDESFQKKCIAWQEEYLNEGGTLLLCSHSMYHVQKLCRHALWMHHGKPERLGPASDVTTEYLAYHEEKAAAERRRHPHYMDTVTGAYAVSRLELRGAPPSQTILSRHRMGDPLSVFVELSSSDGRRPGASIDIVRIDGTPVYGVTSDAEQYRPVRLEGNLFAFQIEFPDLPLLPGKYLVRAHALDPDGMRLFDTVERELFIEGATRELGLCRLDHRWIDGATAWTNG
jgi:lipopolysaccharide transport system ATP-binding protein